MFDEILGVTEDQSDFYSMPTIEEYHTRGQVKVGDHYRKVDIKMNKKGFGMVYTVESIKPLKIMGELVKIGEYDV